MPPPFFELKQPIRSAVNGHVNERCGVRCGIDAHLANAARRKSLEAASRAGGHPFKMPLHALGIGRDAAKQLECPHRLEYGHACA